MKANVKIAVDYTRTSLRVVAKNGVIAFPMFPEANKHDVRSLKQELLKLPEVKSVMADKKVVVVST